MFGRRKVHHTHSPVVVSNTHHTTSTRPHTTGGGLMSRLRPRPRQHTHTHAMAPVATTHRKTTHRSHGLGLGRKHRTHHTTMAAAPRTHHHHTHTTTAAPTAVPARRTSLGDKVSGAMLKLRGSMSGRPGQKAAGTRRMHGTDGRGARRYY